MLALDIIRSRYSNHASQCLLVYFQFPLCFITLYPFLNRLFTKLPEVEKFGLQLAPHISLTIDYKCWRDYSCSLWGVYKPLCLNLAYTWFTILVPWSFCHIIVLINEFVFPQQYHILYSFLLLSVYPFNLFSVL